MLPVEAAAVESIKLEARDGADYLYWKFSKDDVYTVKSRYLLALGFYKPKESSLSLDDGWWKAMWKLKLPSKVKIITRLYPC